MTGGEIIFDPLIVWPLIWTGVAVAVLLVALAWWRGLSGWWLRGLAAAVLLLGLAQPSIQTEEREPLTDIVLMVVDESASQRLSDRLIQNAQAAAAIEAEIAAIPNTELRRITLRDGVDNAGSLILTAMSEALAEEPRARVAGAILITDGQAHDKDIAPQLPAPLHVLLTGHDTDWDRRLVVKTAPVFGIIGEPLSIVMAIEEQGNLPPEEAGRPVTLMITIDGGEPELYEVPVNEDLELPVTLEHGGQNVVQLAIEPQDGELTDRNNAAVVQMNGVRDRLRVLLVSGEPHAGERTWRNLLKSDSSVDLVHFTILRPPEKQDGVPVDELSLIAFPTRELFVEKIEEFDLIIFDRYRLRGILPSGYLLNIRDYVEAGGAVLISAGPEFASAESIFHSPLGEIIPATPTARVLEGAFMPAVSELGRKHPVTEGLTGEATTLAELGGAETEDQLGAEGDAPWGRWLRMIEVADPQGQVVMEGDDNRPLLILNRVGEGRVSLLASDQSWLWSRGFEGGGPQLELLRRLAHWMMKEPQLEEEALTAETDGQQVTITRRTLADRAADVIVTGPDGAEVVLPLTETGPGRFSVDWDAPEIGLYRMTDGEIERVFALGPSAAREFEETIATGDKLAELVEPTNGGIVTLEDGIPGLRTVREGRPASGRGWIGMTPRQAYLTADVRIGALLPAWAFVLLAAALALGAWIREGRG